MGKKSYLSLLCIIMLLLPALSGCSKTASKEDNSLLGIDGYVYTALQIDVKAASDDRFKVMNGYIYYRFVNSNITLRRFPIEELFPMGEELSSENTDSEEQFKMPAGEPLAQAGSFSNHVLDYIVDEDDSLYYLGERIGEDETDCVLVKRRADGSEEYCVSLSGRPNSLALSNENRIYVLTEDFIFIIGEKGKVLERFSVAEGEAAELLEGEAGTVYYYQMGTNEVNEIVPDRQSGSYRLEWLRGPCSNGIFSGSRQGLFYTGNDGVLYRYRKEADSWETVLRWGDSNLICYSDFTILLLSEDRLAVDINIPGQSGKYERAFFVLTKTPVEELPEKEVLVLVMEGNRLFSTLEQYVMDYNRNSDNCHIIIQRDLSRLDAELVSSNPPDLINLTYMDYIKFGEKDVLEDLEPYLESSILLDRKDFREAVLDSCTVKGRLVCIPDEIECTTVIGRASQLGSGAGWTVADVMAFAESHPDAQLFKNNTFSAMIKTFFRDYILEQFVDWENRECYFDGEEFISFIKWVAEHSDGVDSEESFVEDRSEAMPENHLLSIMTEISTPQSLLLSRSHFGEEVVVVGYPTARGEAVYHGTAVNQLGIVAASDKKEAAWQFIESFLARKNGHYMIVPSRLRGGKF